MTLTRIGASAASLAALVATLVLAPAPAQADGDDDLGTRSLAEVLAADGAGFDRNPLDFDILEGAVGAVLTAKPDSPVAVLADGDTALTAFLPTDLAFRQLVNEVAGYDRRTEAEVLAAAASLGIDTIETVLLYHVVPGSTIDYRAALASDGASLVSAQGGELGVDVKRLWRWLPFVEIEDADTDDLDAVVLIPNINRGNVQIAHGITSVLRPIDLP